MIVKDDHDDYDDHNDPQVQDCFCLGEFCLFNTCSRINHFLVFTYSIFGSKALSWRNGFRLI